MLLRWHAWLSLWLCANAGTVLLYRESGDGVTLRCSHAECSGGVQGFSGMYLYKTFVVREEVLYHRSKAGRPNLVTPRGPFRNRTRVDGALRDHNVTIGNLTVHDSGFYSCVYTCFPDKEVECNTYLLAVKGVPCDDNTTTLRAEVIQVGGPSSVLPVTVTCAATALAILAGLLLKRLVKKRMRDRRRGRNRPEPKDCVYEVMTKNCIYTLPAPRQQQQQQQERHQLTVQSL